MFKLTTKSTLLIPVIGISAILGYGLIYYQHHSNISDFLTTDPINLGVSLSEEMVSSYSATITLKGNGNDKVKTTVSAPSLTIPIDPVTVLTPPIVDPDDALTPSNPDPVASLTPPNKATSSSVDLSSSLTPSNLDPVTVLTPPIVDPVTSLTPSNPNTHTTQTTNVPQKNTTQSLNIDPSVLSTVKDPGTPITQVLKVDSAALSIPQNPAPIVPTIIPTNSNPVVPTIIPTTPDPSIVLTSPDPVVALTPQNPNISTAQTVNVPQTDPTQALNVNPSVLPTPQNPNTSTAQTVSVLQTDPTQALNVYPDQATLDASIKAYNAAASKELSSFLDDETITEQALTKNISDLSATHLGQNPSIVLDMQGTINHAINIRNFKSQIKTISDALKQLEIQKATTTNQQNTINSNHVQNSQNLQKLVDDMAKKTSTVEKYKQDKIEEKLTAALEKATKISENKQKFKDKKTKANSVLTKTQTEQKATEHKIHTTTAQITKIDAEVLVQAAKIAPWLTIAPSVRDQINQKIKIHLTKSSDLTRQKWALSDKQKKLKETEEENQKKLEKINDQINELNKFKNTNDSNLQKLKTNQKNYQTTLSKISGLEISITNTKLTVDDMLAKLEASKKEVLNILSQISIKKQEQQNLEQQVAEETKKLFNNIGVTITT